MYLVTLINGTARTVVHEPGTSDVKLDSAKINREVNAFDSFEFDIYPNNPGWDSALPFSTRVEVLNTKTGNIDFEGRVIQPKPRMDSDGLLYRSVVCEGLMGYLCDSQQRYAEEKHYSGDEDMNGLQEFVKLLLDVHNSAVEEHKRIYPGSITLQTFDTSSGVTKAISRASTWDNISDKLIGSFGGEMRVRRGDDGLLYLDYAESLGTTRSTRIALGRNMQDAEREIDPTSVITRLYPYGAKVTVTETDEDGNEQEVETEERIGIEEVYGKPYIDDEVAMAQYGIIEGVQEWDDVTTASNLLTKAQEWLGNNNAMPVSNTFTALDLSQLGLDIDSFNIHDSYPCWNPLIGLDETLEVVKQTIDVCDPEESSIEMGESSYRLSGSIADMGDLQDRFEQFESQQKTEITNVNNYVKSVSAGIQISSDTILSTVNQMLESANEQIQNLTEQVQTIEGWEFNWQEIVTTVNEIGTEQSERLKYIKFIDGEIWLGRDPEGDEDDFKVVISNERIRFLQNNIEVAYISNQQLFITNANVTTQLQIGNFAWMPRSNGNMTLRYIGGGA